MKKALNIIKNILVWLILIAAIGMMIFTIFSVNTFDQSHRSIFGYKFFIVQSDSMSATDFDAGDIIFVKEVDPATLQEGDIIAYTSQNTNNYGETVVTYPYVLGKYTGNLPKIGTFFTFLKTTPGYILCILVPFLLLIGYNGLNCIMLFRRYKREQMEELQAEKAKLDEERRQSAEMMKELQALREQLAHNGTATNPGGNPEP